ncbi:MAG TPA: glutathione S-transferase N-terminal domain-containing protein [Solirubrobacterales bacterium]|nr:glutathione S-transferase N-terminal domain-containing protein [Solirubrobacterales bacterium]
MVKSQREATPIRPAPLPRLYVIPGSHACRAAMLMLEHKGLDWRPFRLLSGLQTVAMRPLGFPGRTVPALKLDGARVQGNRNIARFLDRIEPEPPLLPPHRLTVVEDAERFADEVLQPLARRLVVAAGRRDLSNLVDHADSGRLGALLAPTRRRRRMVMRIAGRFFGISDETERLDLAALPHVLDRVDSMVESGVLDGAQLNAADFQVVPSLWLLAYRRDVRDIVEARPAWRLTERVFALSGRTG